MIKILLKYGTSFLILVFAQLFIFNYIQISGYLNPYIYILFLLLLPFDMPGWILLPLSFFTGLIIDLFMQTPGMHAFATTILGFLRPWVLKYIAPRDGYDSTTLPTLEYNGLSWFIRYAFLLTLAHHLSLFFIEMFRFSDFFPTLLRAIVSTLFTTALLVISQFFFFRR